jgi:hypothetical protein
VITIVAEPNKYVLGGRPEIFVETTDLDGVLFIPSEIRLSIKAPTGIITTVSGAEMTVASGYMYYLYRPPVKGWYATETWVKDGTGREDTAGGGFEVVDYIEGA